MKQGKQIHSLTTRALTYLTGLSYPSLFLLWVVMALAFGVGYFVLTISFPAHAPNIHYNNSIWIMLLDSFYYSIITATSTGYGDITPQGLSKILASLQSICALFVFAVFVTKLVSNKQEVALQQVHKLAFEDVFHNIREGLFIVRKDFEHIKLYAEENKKLSEREWRNLGTAYEQIQSLFGEIPSFYKAMNQFYTIDERREVLLQEGVYRTLDRLNELINQLSELSIDWTANERSFAELEKLVSIMNEITPLWKQHSPYEHEEAFADIVEIHASIEQSMSKVVG